MRACMTASGGAMFIPDTIARKKCKVSYKTLAEDLSGDDFAAESSDTKKEKRSLFGTRKAESDRTRKAA